MKRKKARHLYSSEIQKRIQAPDLPGLDDGIRISVKILIENGIETIQSCQGGKGHCYPEPTIEFTGGYEAGFRALSVALAHGFRVSELRRVWSIQAGEPVGPHWALVFVGLPVSEHG